MGQLRDFAGSLWGGLLAFGLMATVPPPAIGASLEIYGQLPTLEQVAVSPDGSKLVFATTINEQRTVMVTDVTGTTPLATVTAGNQKIRALQWAGPDYLLITTSVTTWVPGLLNATDEYYVVQSLDVRKKKILPFFTPAREAGETLSSVFSLPMVRMIDGRPTAFVKGVHFVGGEGQLGLFKVDIPTGRTNLIDEGGKGAYDWVVGADGSKLARADYEDKKRRWSLRIQAPKGSGWVERYVVEATIERPSLIGLAPDEGIVVGELKGEDYEMTAVSVPDGARLGPVGREDYSHVIEDPVTHRIMGGMRREAGVKYDFFDPKVQAVWNGIAKAYPGEAVQLESWSDDRRKIIVRVDGPNNGASFSLVDLDTKQAKLLGDLYQGVKPGDIAPVRQITYQAADGMEIPAYLTLPRGKEAKNLPLVVLAHGGPADRDLPEFDWWAQALASQGYAVLQPQFRGSDGFGKVHLEAGYGQWGRKMQTDLSDGVRKLAKDGVIDPARVCITGASYGGYAALAGAPLDGGGYRCAASVAGPADLRKMLSREQEGQRSSDNRIMRYWTRFMGAETARDPKLADISPSDHVDKISIPILLVHGKDDTVVHYEQSKLMDAALTKAGKPHSFVSLDGEDHWLSREPTRKQMLSAVVDFLKTNNPPN